jgi:HAD superfamily phosphatase (TIGR01668 family)
LALDRLAQWQIRGIALDLDNTIVPWHTSNLVPGVADWVLAVRQAGIRVCLLTNNYGPQAKDVGRALDITVVRGALKPMPAALRRSLRELQTDPHNSLSIGDQIFTDVLGAKLVGMRAVLVRPIGGRAFITTKFLRMLERPVLKRIQRNGPDNAM